MLNTTQIISRHQSNYSSVNNVNAVQDINPISEELQKQIVSFNERACDYLRKEKYANREIEDFDLCRCANCGYLSTADDFIYFFETYNCADYPKDKIIGCSRCKSKAIFLDKKITKE